MILLCLSLVIMTNATSVYTTQDNSDCMLMQNRECTFYEVREASLWSNILQQRVASLFFYDIFYRTLLSMLCWYSKADACSALSDARCFHGN